MYLFARRCFFFFQYVLGYRFTFTVRVLLQPTASVIRPRSRGSFVFDNGAAERNRLTVKHSLYRLDRSRTAMTSARFRSLRGLARNLRVPQCRATLPISVVNRVRSVLVFRSVFSTKHRNVQQLSLGTQSRAIAVPSTNKIIYYTSPPPPPHKSFRARLSWRFLQNVSARSRFCHNK